MLDWVTGASRSQQDAATDPEDAPETPAHVFAARAFKSLLFGTPAPNDMTVEKPKRLSRLNTISKASRSQSFDIPREPLDKPIGQPRQSESNPSPSKGILVAPGSISTKRKSVTFGSLGRDFEALRKGRLGNKQEQADEANVPTPALVKLQLDLPQEDLRKSLFQCQSGSHGVKAAEETNIAEKENVKPSVVESASTIPNMPDKQKTLLVPRVSRFIEDQTIDLNEPRSSSGQHWKREYERDHDNSKAEMKKLIQYSQMTKSYAEKRDKDAIIVTQKLNEAEAKTKVLETKIRKLAAQLMDAKTHGEEQDAILCEVASQTAEVMKHKGNAERYRATLRKYELLQANDDNDGEDVKSSMLDPDIVELKSELLKVRLAADRAEARAAKADYENTLLSTALQQLKDSKQDLSQQYDKLQDRLNKKTNRLTEENRRLNNELQMANLQCSTMRDELQSLKKAKRISLSYATPQHATDKLFDLSQSRLTKEPSPPTSDEDLRQRIRPTSPRESHRSPAPLMDLSLIGAPDDTFTNRKPEPPRRSHHRKAFSAPQDISQPLINGSDAVSKQVQHFEVRNSQGAETEDVPDILTDIDSISMKRQALDGDALRKSSPLMKSFIDNLGSRRALPPERVAAAKKRLEEKAANRRSTPMYVKVHDKIVV